MSLWSDRLAMALALCIAQVTPALAADVKIDEVVVAISISPAQRDAAIKAARAFYEFWNSGDEAFLKQAIAP